VSLPLFVRIAHATKGWGEILVYKSLVVHIIDIVGICIVEDEEGGIIAKQHRFRIGRGYR
jgi:hypothetical protein